MPAFTAAPLVETERLRLRAHRREDFDDSAAMWADPGVVRYLSGTPSSHEASWARLLRYPGHWALLGFGYWAVETKEDGQYVGEVGFANYRRDMQPPLDERPEAGWVFKTRAHGRGYATEAMLAAHAWMDRELKWPGTVCIIDPRHTASIAVAHKLGYDDESVAKYMADDILVMARRRPRST